MRYPAKTIREEISILDVANKYIKVNSRNRAVCPFCAGNGWTLSFKESTNKFNCFKCQETGSVIDFVKKIENIGVGEAIRKLGKDYDIEPIPETPQREKSALFCLRNDESVIKHSKNRNTAYKSTQQRKQRPNLTNEPLKKESNTKTQLTFETQTTPPIAQLSLRTLEIYAFLEDFLFLTGQGTKYLNSRYLSNKTLKKFNVKSIDNPYSVFSKLKENFSIKELKEAGLINNSNHPNNFIFYKPCVLFFHYENEQIVYITNRNYSNDSKCFKPAGIEEKFFIGNTSKDKIYLLEGVIDGLSLYELNKIDNFICMNGTITSRKVKKIKSLYPNKELAYIFDNDVTGALCMMEVEEEFKGSENINYSTWKDKAEIDVASNIRKDFKTYGKARMFFNIDESRNFERYNHKKIKDVNDYLCKIRR